MTNRHTDRLLTYWPTDWQINLFTDRPIDRLDDCLTAWPTDWLPVTYSPTDQLFRFDLGLTLKTSAFKLFTVANLHYQLS